MRASAKLWAAFRMYRMVVFALNTLLTVGLTVLFSILLYREWNFYSEVQRIVVTTVVSIDALSSVLQYLMIIVHFKLWLDGARTALLLVLLGGGTATFAIFNRALPCNNLGTLSTCKSISSAATYGGWAATSLLLVYAFCLAVMSYIPQPQKRQDPEEVLTQRLEKSPLGYSPSIVSSNSSTTQVADFGPKTGRKDVRRSISNMSESAYSEASASSNGSYMLPTSQPSSPRLKVPYAASNSAAKSYPSAYNRPRTPPLSAWLASMPNSPFQYHPYQVPAAGLRGPPYPIYNTHSRVNSPVSPPRQRTPFLPNPFSEPVAPSRCATPVSVVSGHSDSTAYTPTMRTRNPIEYPVPSSMCPGGRLPSAFAVTNLPGAEQRRIPTRDIPPVLISRPPTPSVRNELIHQPAIIGMRPGTVTEWIPRVMTKTPGAMSVVSQSASIHAHVPPSRGTSLQSIPRSPSPQDFPIPPMGLPCSPNPRMRQMNLYYRGPQFYNDPKGVKTGRQPSRMDTPRPLGYSGTARSPAWGDRPPDYYQGRRA